MKKTLVMLAALLMAATMLLSACETDGSGGDGDDRYTITILTVSHTGELIDANHPAVLALEEHTGYNIELEFILNANYNESMATRLASPLPGLVVITGNIAPIVTAMQSGAFWDITDKYLEYPNLAEVDVNVLNNISVDGKYFGIPRMRAVGRPGMTYRRDWLENVGLEEPKTLDDLYEVLNAFTHDDPDGNGVDDTYGMTWTGFYIGPFYDLAVMHGAPNRWGVRDGKLTPWFEYDEFYEAMDFSKKLFDEGLINKDFAALQTGEWVVPLNTGKVGWHMDVADQCDRTARALRDNGLATQDDVDASKNVWVMGSVANKNGDVRVRAQDGHAGYVAISTTGAKTEEDLHHYLNFLDKCNDEVGQNLLIWGAEGTNYNWMDEETIAAINAADIPNGWNIVEGWNQFRMRFDKQYNVFRRPHQIRQDEVQIENLEFAIHNPTLPIAVKSETWTLRSSTLNQIIDDAVINYIVGNIDRAGFDAEVARWYAEDGQKAVDELQAAYEAVK